MGNHIISFLDICSMRGQLVLAEAPTIPAINDKMVHCIVLDGEEYSQILFVDGTIKLYWY